MALIKLGSKAECSIVKLKENGVLVDFYIFKLNYESGLNGAGRVGIVRKDCYDQRKWHGPNVNALSTSDIDAWFNGDYKKMFEPDIQEAMGETTFYYTPGNGNNTITTLKRSVFPLSATELGKTSSYLNAEGTVLSSTVLNLLKVAYLNGSAVTQWTRSPRTNYTNAAWLLDSGGTLGFSSCSSTYGARPAFTLPSSLYVSDDGIVTVNTAPSTPSSLTVPAQINGGSTITVEWGASTDAEGNLEGYELERSLDGGSAWSNVYRGTGRSTTNTVPFGSETVMYRVRAYDEAGLVSAWRTSSQVTVINNTAPSVPNGINVPEQVQGGHPLTITWGASTDDQDNLAGYSLERQVNGGAWEVIYSGPERSFTDIITKGWLTVDYRVRAYDTANAYSGFAACAEVREVNNNTPAVIVCEHPANVSLGTKSDGFTVEYSVEDEEGDEVTVTESVDGTTLRTFRVELGQPNTLTLGGVDFMRLLNGNHTLTIAANDGASTARYSLPWTKLVTAASVTLERPMEADGPISVCVLSVSGFIPADAAFRVVVTDNAKDEEPVWEDCTAAVRAGGNYVFENQTAGNGFAFNFKLNVERGLSGVGGYLTSVQGGFQ